MNGHLAPRIPTDEFTMLLLNSEDYEAFLLENIHQMNPPSLRDSLIEYCNRQGILPHKLVQNVDIDRIYGYKIFTGERVPSREYILKLALGLSLSLPETQRLLTISKNSQLYPRVPRDAAVIYCLNRNYGYRRAQENLEAWGMPPLGES